MTTLKHIIGASVLALTTFAGASLAQTTTQDAPPAETPSSPSEPEPTTPPPEPAPMPLEPDTSEQTPPSEPPIASQQGTTEGDTTAECPTFLQGAKVNVEEAKDGVSVTVTTEDDANVAMLRDLVDDVAETVEERSKSQAKQKKTEPSTSEAMPKLDVTTRDIEGGAEVTVATEDSNRISSIREQAEGLEKAWTTSSCATSTVSSAGATNAPTSTEPTPPVEEPIDPSEQTNPPME